MEWAMRKQYNLRPIVDEIADGYSYHPMRNLAVKKALL
jgi:hypothetical protein